MIQYSTRRTVLSALWQPLGLLYLAACLLAFMAGLYPRWFYVPITGRIEPVLPALSILAAAQVLFGLLAWPVAALQRAARGRAEHYWRRSGVEMLGLLLVTLPLYVPAAHVSNATAPDVLRVVVYVLCVWTVPLAVGGLLAELREWRWLLLLLPVAAGLALPAVHYIALEFATPTAGRAIGRLAPATFAWQVARQSGGVFPRPAWAALVWPGLAAALALGRIVLTGRYSQRLRRNHASMTSPTQSMTSSTAG